MISHRRQRQHRTYSSAASENIVEVISSSAPNQPTNRAVTFPTPFFQSPTIVYTAVPQAVNHTHRYVLTTHIRFRLTSGMLHRGEGLRQHMGRDIVEAEEGLGAGGKVAGRSPQHGGNPAVSTPHF